MSFKCSIFGHDFGDPEVEREREEDGSEVVITIRETETCARCGETRVVSENKEVTTLETAADIVADDLADESEDTEQVEDEPETAPPTDQASSAQATESAAPAESDPDIPNAEASGPATDPPADASEDDAVILDEDDDTEDEDERKPGEWPEEASADEEDWEPSTDIEPHPATEPEHVESTGNAVTVPEGEFHCPECGFTTEVESSSLREGDFCPECHKGALETHGQ